MKDKEKYFLNEEDIEKLSVEQKATYNDLFEKIKEKGFVDKRRLNEFAKILQQKYESSGVLTGYGADLNNILAANFDNIIDKIGQFRNEIISNNHVFSEYNFKEINRGLDDLKSVINEKIAAAEFNSSFRIGLKSTVGLKENLTRIDQLQNQISQDLTFYQSFQSERMQARRDFLNKQEKYNKLSLFGKLVARVTGKKKALEEAAKKNASYGRATPGGEFGSINASYEQYVDSRLQEQATGGKRR